MQADTIESLKQRIVTLEQQLHHERNVKDSAEDMINEYCNSGDMVVDNCKSCGIWYHRDDLSSCDDCGAPICSGCPCPDCKK